MSINRDQADNLSRADIHNSLGVELTKRGWLDEAINAFSKAVVNAPYCSDSHDNLANAYAEKGELLDALYSYVNAIKLDPENSYAVHNLGCFLSNYGANLAVSCFKNALSIDPELYESYFNLGLCFAAEDKHEKAIVQYERALEHNPDDKEIKFQMAVSLMSLEKFTLAIKQFLFVVSIDDNNEEAWHNLGVCYSEQGFLEESEKSFIKSLQKNSQRVDTILALASLLGRSKRFKEAKKLIKRAKNLDSDQTMEFVAQDENLAELA